MKSAITNLYKNLKHVNLTCYYCTTKSFFNLLSLVQRKQFNTSTRKERIKSLLYKISNKTHEMFTAHTEAQMRQISVSSLLVIRNRNRFHFLVWRTDAWLLANLRTLGHSFSWRRDTEDVAAWHVNYEHPVVLVELRSMFKPREATDFILATKVRTDNITQHSTSTLNALNDRVTSYFDYSVVSECDIHEEQSANCKDTLWLRPTGFNAQPGVPRRQPHRRQA